MSERMTINPEDIIIELECLKDNKKMLYHKTRKLFHCPKCGYSIGVNQI